MRSFLISITLFLLVLGVSCLGNASQVEPFDKLESRTCETADDNLIQIQGLADALTKESESQCPFKEVSTAEQMPAVTFGVFSAQNKMASLFETLNEKQEKFMQDSTGCPRGCKKISDPIVEVSTRPTQYEFDEKCPRVPVAVEFDNKENQKFGIEYTNGFIKKDFHQKGSLRECNDMAMKFAQETLMGDNKVGKHIEKNKCPSVCSYTSTVRLRSKPSAGQECHVDLELVILCGPPKKEREWTTEAKLVKAFRCEAAK